RAKITVFLSTVLILVTVVGSLLYMVEDPYESGFTSIPQSVYWAIVTLTTVGYGDIAPVTGLGKAFASLLMIAGYSLIIVPTGIISSEMVSGGKAVKATTQVCPDCQREGHDGDALHCKFCGGAL
ncbi:MAG: potassium channel family protein, partial [Planctomycetota bacterium]